MSTPVIAEPPCLAEAIERIVQQFHPLRIILFGSWARGDARPDSDLDLLVVMPEAQNKRAMTVRIGNSLSDLPISKDVVVTTPAEIVEHGQTIGRVLQPALAEGKVVY